MSKREDDVSKQQRRKVSFKYLSTRVDCYVEHIEAFRFLRQLFSMSLEDSSLKDELETNITEFIPNREVRDFEVMFHIENFARWFENDKEYFNQHKHKLSFQRALRFLNEGSPAVCETKDKFECKHCKLITEEPDSTERSASHHFLYGNCKSCGMHEMNGVTTCKAKCLHEFILIDRVHGA